MNHGHRHSESEAPGEGSCTGAKARHLADAALLKIGRGPRAQAHAAHAAIDGDAGDAGAGDAGDDDAGTSRRDFLSLMGFSLGAVGLGAGCRAPVQNAIPLPVATPEMVPGVPLTFATTCGACPSSCALLVKQRDGRPIKIDGNPDSSLFGGGSCATGQASLLSLYDSTRLRGPTWLGNPVTWPEVDAHIAAGLARDGRAVVLLSGTITSPSTRAVVAAWQRQVPGFRHVVVDPISAGALREATQRTFGRAVVPHFAFDKARVVVALEADFLGTWLSPVEFARAHAAARRADASETATPSQPALHVQIESGYSVTGSNADLRVAVPPSALGAVAAALHARVSQRAGVAGAAAALDAAFPMTAERINAIADALWAARGASLVVSGSDDVDVQLLVMALNVLLDNIGRTVDVQRASLQRQGDDQALAALTAQMAAGQVGTLIIYGVNPGYHHPDHADDANAPGFLAALAKVPLSIAFSDHLDETSAHVHAVCPDHHFLESWGDAEPVEGWLSLQQPLIAPLFSTRAAPESLLRWLDEPTGARAGAGHYDHLRGYWRREVFPRLIDEADFDSFWDRTLQKGVLQMPPAMAEMSPGDAAVGGQPWNAAVDAAAGRSRRKEVDGRARTLELHRYESVALRDGRHAANPWLQELPDPITRLTWGNVAAVAPALARRLGLVAGDVVALAMGGRRIELPAFVQAGQDPRTVSVALGYGRSAAGSAGTGVGANGFALSQPARTAAAGADATAGLTLEKTGRRVLLPSAQTHLSMEGRPIALTTSLAELRQHPADKAPGGDGQGQGEGERAAEEALPTLWKERRRGEHAWGMAIDLDACTGCSACVVACQVENNVPVVGKDQIQRNRIMHWLRIDRYFDSDDGGAGGAGGAGEGGHADRSATSSLHQPMMCQHCGNAPCETVCPVLATTTSSEGLNQQVYNRCIGTRYCANNCPYKVRRFNWLAYTNAGPHASHMEDPIGRLVLNPDVTVRTRGVMEKCSLCVQRIQLGKNQALLQRRSIGDGDVETACQQSCPTGAVVFGDLMNPDSRVSRLLHGRRAYQVLEDLGTRPNVGYLKRIRRPLPGGER